MRCQAPRSPRSWEIGDLGSASELLSAVSQLLSGIKNSQVAFDIEFIDSLRIIWQKYELAQELCMKLRLPPIPLPERPIIWRTSIMQ